MSVLVDGGCLNASFPMDLSPLALDNLSLGMRFRDFLVPYALQSSLEGSLSIDSGNSSMSPDLYTYKCSTKTPLFTLSRMY